jgi:hypothetical protein
VCRSSASEKTEAKNLTLIDNLVAADTFAPDAFKQDPTLLSKLAAKAQARADMSGRSFLTGACVRACVCVFVCYGLRCDHLLLFEA